MKLRARLFRARVLEKVEASVLRAAEKISAPSPSKGRVFTPKLWACSLQSGKERPAQVSCDAGQAGRGIAAQDLAGPGRGAGAIFNAEFPEDMFEVLFHRKMFGMESEGRRRHLNDTIPSPDLPKRIFAP